MMQEVVKREAKCEEREAEFEKCKRMKTKKPVKPAMKHKQTQTAKITLMDTWNTANTKSYQSTISYK
jgi:hypothetical protein